MKYKEGDIVKLRDDLEVDKFYKGIKFIYEMERLKHLPIELIKHEVFNNCYKVEDYNGNDYIVSEAMIEGLWEECKGIAYEPYEEKTNKLKLIDILNKIANGELKEDYRTEIKMNGLYYRLFACETADNLLTDLFIHLNDEVELIEPHQSDNAKIKELTQLARGLSNDKEKINIMWDKLNEVIRYINKED